MPNKHEHNHSEKNLRVAFLLNFGFSILEIFGGIYTNSVAIISDAIHDLGDSFSIGIALLLNKKSKKGPDSQYSFGYGRFSLLGAVINSLILLMGSAFVLNEAILRILEPQKANAQGMVVFAVIGITVNAYAAWKLRKGKSINERVVSWHLIEDALGWVAVLIASVVLLFVEVPLLDPILSILITIFILWNVVKRLKQATLIFLQKIPESISLENIEKRLLNVNHVDSLHYTQIWSLEGENHVFTTHIRLKNIRELVDLIETKRKLKDILSEYPFQYFTIETELDEETCAVLELEKKRKLMNESSDQ
jgi:cobalt-zinc-cadmium efflux system protein